MAEIHIEQDGAPPRVPKAMLLAAAAMVTLAMAMAATAKTTDTGALRIAEARPVDARDLRFADRADGAVVVTDAATGETVHVLQPGVNSFVRGALRGLAFDRKRSHVGAERPFRLALGRDGRLTLRDPATGVVLDLAAYGPDNERAFAELLHKVR